jgi:hypothetical protein
MSIIVGVRHRAIAILQPEDTAASVPDKALAAPVMIAPWDHLGHS